MLYSPGGRYAIFHSGSLFTLFYMVMHCNITQEVKELVKKLYFVLLFSRETIRLIVHIVYPFLHGCGLHYNVLSGLSVKQEVKWLTTKLHIHALPRKKIGLLANI